MRPRTWIPIYAERYRGERTGTHGRLAALIVIVVLSPLGSASADADEYDAATAMAVPASVSTVVEAGLWGDGGCYRVVVTQRGFEHTYNNVYAQWLSTDGKGKSKIEKSIQVKQLSNLVPSVIGDVRFVFPSKESKGVFEVDVVNRDTQKSAIALLHMGKPGELSVDLPPAELAE
jgi:hypothetical protein